MAGKKVGSDGQIRKTTAEWAADTATYPEGMRLMDVTTGTVRVSKGTTYALAWTSGAPGSYSPPIPQSDVSGLATAFENVYSAIAQEASDRATVDGALDLELAAKADSASLPLRYKFTGDGGAATGTVVANTLGVTINVTNPVAGEYRFTAASGTPFTANKTTAIVQSADGTAAYMAGFELTSDTQVRAYLFDDAGAPVDPTLYQVIIEVEP